MRWEHAAPEGGLAGILRALPQNKVLVLGDVIVDEYVFGEATRISPEAPVPVVEFGSRKHAPGGAGNVAANLAALGCVPLLAGVAGADPEAQHLHQALVNAGVNFKAILVDRERPTTVKMRIIARDRQIVRLDRETRAPISPVFEKALIDWLEQSVLQASACVLSDYGKGVVTGRIADGVINTCARAGVPVLVDPKSLAMRFFQGATLVKPNIHEAERLANRPLHDEADFLEAGRKLADTAQAGAVLITRGARGMSLFRRGKKPFHVAAAARSVYDVTGAGDTVISTIAAALATGAPLEDAVRLASLSAAIAVGKSGTATVNAAELNHAIGNQDD